MVETGRKTVGRDGERVFDRSSRMYEKVFQVRECSGMFLWKARAELWKARAELWMARAELAPS